MSVYWRSEGGQANNKKMSPMWKCTKMRILRIFIFCQKKLKLFLWKVEIFQKKKEKQFNKKYMNKSKYLHNNAAAFVNWALGCCVAAVNGCVIAAKAARFWIFIGGNKPAAATAADSAVCAFSPGKCKQFFLAN